MVVAGVYSWAVCVSSVMNYMLNSASASVCVCEDYLTVHTPTPFMAITISLCVCVCLNLLSDSLKSDLQFNFFIKYLIQVFED